MTTKTQRQIINWVSIVWGVVALLVWIGDYDLTQLGIGEQMSNTIKFIAAALVIVLQSIKPREDKTKEDFNSSL